MRKLFTAALSVKSWPTSLSPVLHGYSQIFLQRNALCGLLCLCSIAWGDLHMLAGALLAGVTGWLCAVLARCPQAEIDSGLYGYNAALLGLLLCAFFTVTPLLVLVLIGSAALSSLLLHAWLRHSHRPNSLPAYTAPFVLLSWLLLALADSLHLVSRAAPASPIYHHALLDIPLAALRGLSQVLLINDALTGFVIFAALYLASQRMALWALAGSSLSLLLALLVDQDSAALQGLFGFNGALTAIVLSQRYQQAWLSITGILLSSAVQLSLLAAGCSIALTAPFILACWLIQLSSQRLKQKPTTH
jgi:urea transporter